MQTKILIKLLVLGGISILMLIALGSIGGLTNERKSRLQEVERDIAASYAGTQVVGGPVFAVTFREFWNDRLYNEEKDLWYDKEKSALSNTLLFPKSCSYDGTLSVEERYRGIFKANVFQSEGVISGKIAFPELETLATREVIRIEPVMVRICFLVSDPRGISVTEFEWDGPVADFKAGSTLAASSSGIHADLPEVSNLFGERFDFKMGLDVYGTGSIKFAPVGDNNQVLLQSDWSHPSFTGDFLAKERSISADGFEAEWTVNSLACSVQQSINSGKKYMQSFGVDLIDPISPYPLTDRALKYGFLFIFITFAAFFMFEMVADLKIHPIQYGFVGLAQSVFFLLLLSLSEHLGFDLSYLVATGATVGLISFYLCHVLGGLKRGLLFGGLLALLYGVLNALLRSEDHALVAGSVLVFGLMTLVMLLTRKIDWYALGNKTEVGVVK